ncbi:hypothetical protein FOHLNKBM_2156 [Methylobacterium longum]|jgi:hypothetical protein|nr:hypothetical protein FOHLNKBM_2156 [Methylobacterium longum]
MPERLGPWPAAIRCIEAGGMRPVVDSGADHAPLYSSLMSL